MNDNLDKALLINGVYESVLEEIMKSQEEKPDNTFYLQPYSQEFIKLLKESPPSESEPITLYISTTKQLNHICYNADIVKWENKSALSQERLSELKNHIKRYQPEEIEIYLKDKDGRRYANLISIKNLKRLPNLFSTSNLIKMSDQKPIKPRTRSGGWSYVYELPIISSGEIILENKFKKDFDNKVAQSLTDDDQARKRRLENAPPTPEKVQTISFSYKRNPDVVAEVLRRANGKCELCGQEAPFNKLVDGSPYLEVHHWQQLSENGKDTVDNAVALCPNCHKQAHFGTYKDYIKLNKALPKIFVE